MKINSTKPYKAAAPIDTINRIRTILNDIDIITSEQHQIHLNSELFSSIVSVQNNNLHNYILATNGKGLSIEYSLASSYAEFMERLQNNILPFQNSILKYATRFFLDNNPHLETFRNSLEKRDLILEYRFSPDEKFISLADLDNSQRAFLNKIYDFESDKRKTLVFNDSGDSRLLYVPFYNVNKNEIVDLPLEVLLLSSACNGMCAGNTKEEALIHGICEILERYVLFRIYQQEITPPTIPIDVFSGTEVYNLMNKIKSELNISVIIKDCSLGLNLPVIGVILIDHMNNKYTFKLGSDLNPIISIQRCLSEIYQGGSSPNFRTVNFSNNYTNIKDEKEKLLTQENEYLKSRMDGSGEWPNSIFGDSDSYLFTGISEPNLDSDSEELKYLENLISSLGYEIYIRDVSYLDFPSFHVFIPGMSDSEIVFERSVKKGNHFLSMNTNVPLHFNIKNASLSDLKDIAKAFKDEMSKTISLFPFNINEDNEVNVNFLLSMIYYKLKDYKNSYYYLDEFISENNDIDISYYTCIREYLYFKSEYLSEKGIEKILLKFYKSNVVQEVIHDLSNERDIFQYSKFPNCFNCQNCEISNECNYLDILRLNKRLQKKQKDNFIDQSKLMKVINIER